MNNKYKFRLKKFKLENACIHLLKIDILIQKYNKHLNSSIHQII